MEQWDDTLQRAKLNTSANPAEAQAALAEIIAACSDAELRELGSSIESIISGFFPKRQRVLRKLLAIRTDQPPTSVLAPKIDGPTLPTPSIVWPPAEPSAEKLLTDTLGRIEQLNRTVQPAVAESEFRALLTALRHEEISRHVGELRACLDGFLPKRRSALAKTLDTALTEAVALPAPPSPPVPTPAGSPIPVRVGAPKPTPVRQHTSAVASHEATPARVPLAYAKDHLSDDLEDLANRHIFQWPTFYRDVLSRYFDAFLDALDSGEKPAPWLNLMKASLSRHATDIFQRGYRYQLENFPGRSHYAITKSLAGLQRFLDLPLEFYSARLPEAHHADGAGHLRQLCSAMVSGILIGYANSKLDQTGGKVLPRFSGSWVHVLPFVTFEDLRELTGSLQPGVLLDGVHDSVLPFVRTLDQLLTRHPAVAPLPALSQYSDGNRRLEVSLQMPPNALESRRIEVLCCLEERHVDRLLIEEAAGRAIGVVIAPLRADLRMELFATERLFDIVVATGGSSEDSQAKLYALLEDLLYETRSTTTNRTVDFNYVAAYFPLDSPFLTRYSHVYRTSVRKLMQSFERRNGARLWCSVRRSGKTTACASDLGSTSAQSVVVTQTCDSTGQMADGGTFYLRIQEAFDSGRRLPENFVATTVAECMSAQSDARVVLVLDEYETLFGFLRTSMENNAALRYTLVQPLLNQLVTFTRDNLLIFVGQRPDAHWILTDQNQLSPVLRQDPFPLFTHGPAATSTSEFHELVQKMMSSHVGLDPDFVDLVFAETGGHPFLTGKLLVTFVDWLIANQRPATSLAPVRPELFREFTDACMGHTSIAHNDQYEMFRRAASDHLSSSNRDKEPWLHAVYSVLRNLVLSSPDTFSVLHNEFLELAERTSDLVPPDDLLSTASRANFLVFESGVVRPRIPLLGRIAAAVTPQ
jgi:hypothetical protein